MMPSEGIPMRAIRAVDVFLLGTATLLGLLMLALQAWTPMWWAALLATIFIVVATALHMTLGGSVRRIVNLTLLAFAVIGGPWFGYWYWSNYPASFKIMQAWFPAPTVIQPPKVAPALPPPRVTEATPERAVYKCKRSGASAQKTDDARFVEFKKYIEVYADTNGYTPKITSVPGGFKAELTAATPLGQKNLGSATKVTLEVRTLGHDLLGIFSAEYPTTLWVGYLLPSGSGAEVKIRKRIEDLVGADPGDCELQ
jgi:hypothetical protein